MYVSVILSTMTRLLRLGMTRAGDLSVRCGLQIVTRVKITWYQTHVRNLTNVQGVFFFTGTPPKVQSTKKLIKARLGVSRLIYVNVDSPNLGFPYFNFLWGYQ